MMIIFILIDLVYDLIRFADSRKKHVHLQIFHWLIFKFVTNKIIEKSPKNKMISQ